jgi:glucose/arabinose dehydrogenase
MALLVASAPARAGIDWPAPVLAATATGLSQPTSVVHAGDGSGRLFVTERTGKVRIVSGGQVLATPFLDVGSKITADGSEQGLLGIAFPPGYASKQHFYLNYTRRADGATVIARYGLSTGDVADPSSEQIVLTIAQPFPNHNGGQLQFGPTDGYLYVGMGDGGSGGDPANRAQNPAELLGKLLRIDVESGAATYTVPPTNPLIGGRRSEVWALGLRNPWRFSFDRETNDLYIADVGQSLVEEIDFQPAASGGGENYGWRIMEGSRCYNPTAGCSTAGLTLPVAEYDHNQGCSVSGGYVYRGPTYRRMQGVYFYGDYCTGRIWALARDGGTWQTQQLLDTSYAITTFGEDESGELYLADADSGSLYRVTDRSGPTVTCTASASASVPAPGERRLLVPLVPRGCGA